MDNILGKLPDSITNFSGNILSYALILAAVSTITMSLLELVKALAKLRPIYHKRRVKQWLRDTVCFEELLVLTVADKDSSEALFDQPTDKMMGQIQAAANVVIDFPEIYPEIYDFLTHVPYSSVKASKRNEEPNIKMINDDGDAIIWKNFLSRDSVTEITDGVVKEATRARARIDHFVARKLDAFQTRTEFMWARINQFVSVCASAIFLLFILLNIHTPVLPSIILAFFGGMMAPLAKDVVTALSGLRAK